MEKDKISFWKGLWIFIEAVVSIFVIWLICTLFTAVLTAVVMGIRYGECTITLMEQNFTYIKVGYVTIFTAAVAEYLRRLYRKYKLNSNGE